MVQNKLTYLLISIQIVDSGCCNNCNGMGISNNGRFNLFGIVITFVGI